MSAVVGRRFVNLVLVLFVMFMCASGARVRRGKASRSAAENAEQLVKEKTAADQQFINAEASVDKTDEQLISGTDAIDGADEQLADEQGATDVADEQLSTTDDGEDEELADEEAATDVADEQLSTADDGEDEDEELADEEAATDVADGQLSTADDGEDEELAGEQLSTPIDPGSLAEDDTCVSKLDDKFCCGSAEQDHCKKVASMKFAECKKEPQKKLDKCSGIFKGRNHNDACKVEYHRAEAICNKEWMENLEKCTGEAQCKDDTREVCPGLVTKGTKGTKCGWVRFKGSKCQCMPGLCWSDLRGECVPDGDQNKPKKRPSLPLPTEVGAHRSHWSVPVPRTPPAPHTASQLPSTEVQQPTPPNPTPPPPPPPPPSLPQAGTSSGKVPDPRYTKFFKQKKMGVPVPAIKMKMGIEGLDPNLIDAEGPPLIAASPSSSPGARPALADLLGGRKNLKKVKKNKKKAPGKKPTGKAGLIAELQAKQRARMNQRTHSAGWIDPFEKSNTVQEESNPLIAELKRKQRSKANNASSAWVDPFANKNMSKHKGSTPSWARHTQSSTAKVRKGKSNRLSAPW